MKKSILALSSIVAAFAVGACTHAPTMSATVDAPVLLSVLPANNATNTNPSAPIVLTFNHAMANGMEMFIVLHEESVTGAQVAGAALWSSDRLRLTFTPAQPLRPKTVYVLHLAPSLADINGRMLDYAACAGNVGGQPVQRGMMSGTMGPGMMGSGWRMGSGEWRFGMTFTFTTA